MANPTYPTQGDSQVKVPASDKAALEAGSSATAGAKGGKPA